MNTSLQIGVLSSRVSAEDDVEDDTAGPDVPATPYELTAMLTKEVRDELRRAWGSDWLTHLR